MARKKANIDIPNLRGKLALVTGASDGLGLEIARRLALAGAEVIMPVRNPKKGAAAVDRIAADGTRFGGQHPRTGPRLAAVGA